MKPISILIIVALCITICSADVNDGNQQMNIGRNRWRWQVRNRAPSMNAGLAQMKKGCDAKCKGYFGGPKSCARCCKNTLKKNGGKCDSKDKKTANCGCS